eukprot:8467311-Pyramimonas_sp.AAC.1
MCTALGKVPPDWAVRLDANLQSPARGIDYGSAAAHPRMTSLRIPDSPVPGKGYGHTDRTDASLPGP